MLDSVPDRLFRGAAVPRVRAEAARTGGGPAQVFRERRGAEEEHRGHEGGFGGVRAGGAEQKVGKEEEKEEAQVRGGRGGKRSQRGAGGRGRAAEEKEKKEEE